MRLSDVLRQECIKTGAMVEDKAIALCEIAALAKRSSVCKNLSGEVILEALQERETLGTTAFGHGVAIPHCRIQGIRDFVVGAITIPEGVDFEAPDNQPVFLLIFILAPTDRSNTHIRLLSSISMAIQETEVIRKLLLIKDPKQFSETLIQSTGPDIRTDQPTPKCLLHVLVQDEPVFQEILSALSGLEAGSLAVLKAESTRPYLANLPLYADFAGNNGNGSVCKIIIGIVEQRLRNEIVRRIEAITGPLQECSGVMVTAQNLDYSAGTLES